MDVIYKEYQQVNNSLRGNLNGYTGRNNNYEGVYGGFVYCVSNKGGKTILDFGTSYYLDLEYM